MSIVQISRAASVDEIVAEMDRRGKVIERLEARLAHIDGIYPGAIDNLLHHQRQLDMDGIEVAVSRQALCEVLAGIDAVLAAAPSPSSEAVGWRPIESAPKDGTRIIVKAVTFGWSSDVCQNVATGDKAVEARWAKDLSGEYKWLEWCGNDRTYSTGGALVPLGWLPLPAAPVSHGGGRGE